MTAIGTSIVAWAFTPLGPISVILVAAAAGIAVYFICRHLVKPADTPVSQPVSSAPAAILNEGDMRGTYKINTSGHKQSLHNKGSIDAEMNITATVSEREANKE